MIPFVSIIIPVYNAEKTLTRCLESVLSQTDNDYEVIIIDDGSTDGSLSICYGYENEAIKVIHQDNQGVSFARNNGIANACGRYLFFVDADDYIEPSCIESLKRNWTVGDSFDICFFGIFHESNSVVKVSPSSYKGAKSPAVLLKLMQQNLFGLACNKVIKHSIVEDNSLLFTAGRKVFEDQELLMKVWEASHNICCINEAFYHYVQNDNSAMSNMTSENFDSFFAMKNENLVLLKKFMGENEIIDDEITQYLAMCAISDIRVTIKKLSVLSGDELRNGVATVKNGKMHQLIMSEKDNNVKVKLYRFFLGKSNAEIRLRIFNPLLRILL